MSMGVYESVFVCMKVHMGVLVCVYVKVFMCVRMEVCVCVSVRETLHSLWELKMVLLS